jgi:hypothetical protein
MSPYEIPSAELDPMQAWRVPVEPNGQLAHHAMLGAGEDKIQIVDFATAAQEALYGSRRWQGYDEITWAQRAHVAVLVQEHADGEPLQLAEDIDRVAAADGHLWVVANHAGKAYRAVRLVGAEVIRNNVVLDVMGKDDRIRALQLDGGGDEPLQLYVQPKKRAA